MHVLNRELSANSVEVLCYLSLPSSICHGFVVLLSNFLGNKTSHMRHPFLDILNDELVIDVLEEPVAP